MSQVPEPAGSSFAELGVTEPVTVFDAYTWHTRKWVRFDDMPFTEDTVHELRRQCYVLVGLKAGTHYGDFRISEFPGAPPFFKTRNE
jgi:hypothetical protein